MATITLFDVGSKTSECWSPFVWRTRLLLNYKQIPYTTQYLEYPNIEPFLSSKGIPPCSAAGATPYTVPAIQLPSGEYIMDSEAIAAELERQYPTPGLAVGCDAEKAMRAKISPAWSPVFPNVLPNVPRNILNDASLEFFYRTREETFKMPIDQVERERGGEPAYAAGEEGWRELAELFGENKEGPFLTGREPIYADFVMAGILEFARRAKQEIFERIVGPNPPLRELHDACRPWLARNSH